MRGRYESWFLSARDAEPGRPPRALWIRHTRHRFAGSEIESAARWCTIFDPAGGGGPAAVKESGVHLDDGAACGATRFHGGARAHGRMAEWELTVAGGGVGELRHLHPGLLYRLPLPRTKLVAPVPDGVVSGRVVVDGVVVDVVGWRATVGHNWGREHAERWVWLHASGFPDAPEAWLELALARVRVGGALTPWIASGAVFVGGRRFRLGGLGHIPGVRVVAAPGRLEAIVPGKGIEIRVAAHADLDQTVGFTYAGTREGDARTVLHSGLASVRLGVRRPGRSSAELATTSGGAFELGGRGLETNGVPLQPYPDP
ncbi:hypothetical protein OJ997_15080 [Solirubrobacter phytolaccae]|uniref:Uncharacterized protein n=1 Tax=Solirubrobacter phytolaccae TaxID=1404360 RepID=A0A9X3NBB8_9ACTN|nr:hypothetical protein [Solirubrobacter phytolaccae]MDA0181627.1 hypothetical protein [Solirubrobacter phytolaccae]